MLKLICSDVDGTLVPDGGHELNPEYFLPKRSSVLVPYLDMLQKDLDDRPD